MNSQQQTTSDQKIVPDPKTVSDKKTVSDQKTILKQDDHMRNLEVIEMTITAISHPFPSIVRIRGEINTTQPDLWTTPNLAIRLEVHQQTDSLPISRVYTVRCFDPSTRQIEIDFVLHADPSPAMLWLDSAKIGTKIQLTGPRPHFIPNFTPAKRVVMFADETAIPAVYSILQHWQPGIQGEIYIESCEANIIDDLPKHHGVNMHLLHREKPQQAGKLGMLLKVAEQFKDREDISVWAACERNEARAIRKLFTQHSHLSKDDIRVAGYWNVGMSSSTLDLSRVAYYQKHLEQGKTLETFDDLDMPV